MTLLRFILCLFALIGLLAAVGAFVLSIIVLFRFPPLLIVVVLAGGMFVYLMRKIAPHW